MQYAMVERLLQDPRVDPTADNNRLAVCQHDTAIVARLLEDPRVKLTSALSLA